jgi:hypothetical protein
MKNYRPLTSLEHEKYLINVGGYGNVTMQAIMYAPKEFKTFIIKLDHHIF